MRKPANNSKVMRHSQSTGFTLILLMSLCLADNTLAQTERRFTGIEPLGHYANEVVGIKGSANACEDAFSWQLFCKVERDSE